MQLSKQQTPLLTSGNVNRRVKLTSKFDYEHTVEKSHVEHIFNVTSTSREMNDDYTL